MERKFTYRITSEDAGKTVLAYLREQGYSRHLLGGLKPFRDAVLRNGVFVRMSGILQEGDVIGVTLRDEEDSENVLPVPVPFSIAWEDEDLMVVNKPAGISIHPAPGHPADTLANGLAWHYRQKGVPYVFRCINRLDRDTTGLLILANNVLASSILEAALQRREIRRTYLAVVEGETDDSGTIDLPIARTPGSLIERCVDEAAGKRAVTHYRTLARFSSAPCPHSLVELHLDTGRTHQIRVHMTAAGHPLAGDTLYNPRYKALFPYHKDAAPAGLSASSDAFRSAADVFGAAPAGNADPSCPEPLCSRAAAGDPSGSFRAEPAPPGFPVMRRQALHSWKLDFRHPVTKEAMQITAPLPGDMLQFLREISGRPDYTL